jgi:hypothetical protein
VDAAGGLEDVELATELVRGVLGGVDDTGTGLGVVDDTGVGLDAIDDIGAGIGVLDDTGAGIGVLDDTGTGLEAGLPETLLAPQTFVLLLGLPKPFLR